MPMPWLIASRDERILTGSPLTRISPEFGLVEAVENRHQRRFSGAILADDAVNDAAFDDEIDVIVGVNRAEALVDADQFDGGRGFLGLSGHAGRSSPRFVSWGQVPSANRPDAARLPPLRIGAGEGGRAKPGGAAPGGSSYAGRRAGLKPAHTGHLLSDM